MFMEASYSAVSDSEAKKRLKRLNKKMSSEDFEVLVTLKNLKSELDCVHKNLDYVTNPILIDSYIYEIKALHMKYEYYLTLCKERGLTSGLLA